MSIDKDSGDAAHPHDDTHHLLSVGNSIVLGLVLFVMTVSIFLVISLRNDVAALEEQTRKSVKATKATQDEIASIKELLAGNRPKAEPAGTPAAATPSNIDAADSARDCVIGAGNKGGLANCMGLESQQKR